MRVGDSQNRKTLGMTLLRITTAAVTVLALQTAGALVASDLGMIEGAAFAKSDKAKGKSKSRGGKPEHAGKRSETKEKNIHAQLKGLNSLGRNINGLMNSSDPKMEPFRAIVLAGAELDGAMQDLLDAQSAYDELGIDFLAALEALGMDAPTTDEEYEALMAELFLLSGGEEPDWADYDGFFFDDEEGYAEAMAAWDAYQSLQSWYDLQGAQSEVDDLFAMLDDDAVTQAIVDGMNETGTGDFTTDGVTEEMLQWVKDQLGIDGVDENGETVEVDGLIDDYLAGQEDTTADAGDVDASDDSEEG